MEAHAGVFEMQSTVRFHIQFVGFQQRRFFSAKAEKVRHAGHFDEPVTAKNMFRRSVHVFSVSSPWRSNVFLSFCRKETVPAQIYELDIKIQA